MSAHDGMFHGLWSRRRFLRVGVSCMWLKVRARSDLCRGRPLAGNHAVQAFRIQERVREQQPET